MRKITGPQITLFFFMLGIILLLGVGTAYGLLGRLPPLQMTSRARCMARSSGR